MITRTKDAITDKFIKYLIDRGVSVKTLKNYTSDVNNFSSFVTQNVKSLGGSAEGLTEAIPFLTSDTASNYKKYLSNANASVSTVNRRLSTLRSLAKFLKEEGVIEDNSALSTTSIQDKEDKTLSDFAKYLQGQKVSKNTAKNYISDIRQFIAWIEKNY